MYNEQLEQLIEAALKDGMMSGKERNSLKTSGRAKNTT